MSRILDRDGLRALLARPNIHDIVDAADEFRRERHGRRASFAVVAQLDCGRDLPWCPVTGAEAPPEGFPTRLEDLPDEATDLVLLLPDAPLLEQIERTLSSLPLRPADGRTGEVDATLHAGTSSQWITAIDRAGADDSEVLGEWTERGLHAVSDGVRPVFHPAHGPESGRRHARFWRAAARAGVRGHAAVLFGPHHGLDDIFVQIAALAALQEETGVFLTVAPCVYDPAGFGGSADAALTHASFDLRVLAACRLGLSSIEHVTLLYDRSDLKSAHTALLCGVDDLCGHLFLGPRDRKADVEAKDLSLSEMVAWLAEAGFEPCRRNALFQSVATSPPGGPATKP